MMMWLSLTSVVAQRSQRRRAGLTRHTRHANIFLLLFTVCVCVCIVYALLTLYVRLWSTVPFLRQISRYSRDQNAMAVN